jgi:hypothetical protein
MVNAKEMLKQNFNISGLCLLLNGNPTIVFRLSLLLSLIITLSSCSLIDSISGVGFNPEQMEKAREAKIVVLRLKSALALKEKIDKKELYKDDITINLSDDMLNKFLDLYESSEGMLDKETLYKINKVDLQLLNGSAIAYVELIAYNQKYNIDIKLIMDCFLTIESAGKDLVLKLEPFNITPIVKTSGFYSAAKRIIKKLLQLNLAELSKKLPFIKIPVTIENKVDIEESVTKIKSQINLSLINPKRELNYKLKIKDILFFEKMVYVSLNIDRILVK